MARVGIHCRKVGGVIIARVKEGRGVIIATAGIHCRKLGGVIMYSEGLNIL
jgi:hypothetical protein